VSVATLHPFHPLRVAEVEPLTDDAIAVTFDVPAGLREAFRFAPGQHLTLRRILDGTELRRTYSICSSAVSGPLRVAVKRLDGGQFSGWAQQSLRVGMEVDVMTPAGSFTPRLDPAAGRHCAAVAAGSGITPVLSILTTVLEAEPASRFTLVYGNRTSRDVMFLEELADLKDRYPARLQLVHVLSREPQQADLLTGRIDPEKMRRLLAGVVAPDDVDEWFLCGPFGMVMAVRDTLLEAGVSAAKVHLELFHVDGEPVRPARVVRADGSASTVTAVLAGRATVVDVDYDGPSILDALLAVRPDAPYACKSGVCGTCRARLVDGSVELDRNYALEPDEVEHGVVLTCQAHPTSARVTVEYE